MRESNNRLRVVYPTVTLVASTQSLAGLLGQLRVVDRRSRIARQTNADRDSVSGQWDQGRHGGLVPARPRHRRPGPMGHHHRRFMGDRSVRPSRSQLIIRSPDGPWRGTGRSMIAKTRQPSKHSVRSAAGAGKPGGNGRPALDRGVCVTVRVAVESSVGEFLRSALGHYPSLRQIDRSAALDSIRRDSGGLERRSQNSREADRPLLIRAQANQVRSNMG